MMLMDLRLSSVSKLLHVTTRSLQAKRGAMNYCHQMCINGGLLSDTNKMLFTYEYMCFSLGSLKHLRYFLKYKIKTGVPM